MDKYESFIYDYLGGFRKAVRNGLWPLKEMLVKTLSNGTQDSVQADKNHTRILKLRVVGVGFGRTGTYSLKLALDELGYPTLHTTHMYESPGILNMWADLVFHPAIEQGKLLMGNPDFDVITSYGFEATVDLPTALYYKELNKKFPECKFILTVRDDSETWFRSFEAMITSIDEAIRFLPGAHYFEHARQYALYFRWLSAIVNKNAAILDTPIEDRIPSPDKEQAIATYEAHNKNVIDVIPKDRLLLYNVQDGWEPLCKFLDVAAKDCPTVPFPKANTAAFLRAETNWSTAICYLGIAFTVFLFVTSIKTCKKKILCDGKFPRRTILAKKVF